jgi:hypothetical protein
MTLEERAEAYHATFPKYPKMWVDGGWLMGVWVIGALYKRPNPEYYGAFPHGFARRTLSMFPDRVKTLHLFSGTIQAGIGEITTDINPILKPSVVADARHLPFQVGSFDLVVADPPYSTKDAENYGYGMPSRLHVVRGVRSIVPTGGYLCWLDTVRPMYSKLLWKQVGTVMVLVSTNTRTRCLSIFEAV